MDKDEIYVNDIIQLVKKCARLELPDTYDKRMKEDLRLPILFLESQIQKLKKELGEY